jgi:hypothetical protein
MGGELSGPSTGAAAAAPSALPALSETFLMSAKPPDIREVSA